jgi:hypothetical protein
MLSQNLNHISDELAQRLKVECGISIGGKLGNFVPILGTANHFGRAFASFFRNKGLAQAQDGKMVNGGKMLSQKFVQQAQKTSDSDDDIIF